MSRPGQVRAKPEALLVDFDGTLRRWDPAVPAAAEQRYGLPAGILWHTAFEPDRLRLAVTGRISHAEWMAGVAAAVGSVEAVADWQRYHGDVDTALLDVVRQVRATGRPVALVSNGTDQLDTDLAVLGLTGEFSAVVSSATLGVVKPAAAFFTAAGRAIGVLPSHCLLVDDSDWVVRGARAAGLAAIRWTGAADLRYLRAALELADPA